MKKILYSSLILGSAFALASCSADEPGAAKGDGTTTLTVQLPGDLATRYGEGTSVTTLYYSVFPAGTVADADGNLPAPLISGSQEWPAGQTTTSVELTLVPGDDYDVVFFADNSAAEESGAYTYNVASGNLSIDYTKIASNSDAYDAFFNKVEGLNTTFTDVIELNRPFAQLNIGTNDYNLGVVENHLKNGSYSSTLDLKTTGLASGVNFMTNTYTAATDPFTVSIDELSTKTFGFPAGEENEYAYLEMNYLLVDPATDAPTLVEATYTVTAGTTEVNKLDLTNLPLRANYQTNVYGALLTTKSTFNVEIKPGFALPAYDKNLEPVTVTTDEEFAEALSSAGKIIIPENTEINLAVVPTSTGTTYGVKVTQPLELVVDGKLTASVAGDNPTNSKNYTHFYVGNEMKISGGGTIEATNGQSLFYVYTTGNLELEDVNINFTGTTAGGANPYMLRTDGETSISNSVINVNGNYSALLHRGSKPLTINNTTFNIKGCASTTEGLRSYGTDVLTNVTVNSDGRGYSIEAQSNPFNATLNDCVMYAAGDRVLYAQASGLKSGDSSLTINGGKYSCKVTKISKYQSPIVFDNNQGLWPFKVELNGGEYVTQPWGFQTSGADDDPSVYLGEGWEWEAITPATTNPVYAWKVVKK